VKVINLSVPETCGSTQPNKGDREQNFETHMDFWATFISNPITNTVYLVSFLLTSWYLDSFLSLTSNLIFSCLQLSWKTSLKIPLRHSKQLWPDGYYKVKFNYTIISFAHKPHSAVLYVFTSRLEGWNYIYICVTF